MNLSPHFKLSEFLSPDSPDIPNEAIQNLSKLAYKLEEVRKELGGKPITITSGYRTAAHNKAVGGASKSFHMRGMAADFVVAGVAPKVVQAILEDWEGGLGRYKTFTHIDIGPKRRF